MVIHLANIYCRTSAIQGSMLGAEDTVINVFTELLFCSAKGHEKYGVLRLYYLV